MKFDVVMLIQMQSVRQKISFPILRALVFPIMIAPLPRCFQEFVICRRGTSSLGAETAPAPPAHVQEGRLPAAGFERNREYPYQFSDGQNCARSRVQFQTTISQRGPSGLSCRMCRQLQANGKLTHSKERKKSSLFNKSHGNVEIISCQKT